MGVQINLTITVEDARGESEEFIYAEDLVAAGNSAFLHYEISRAMQRAVLSVHRRTRRLYGDAVPDGG